MGIMSFFGFVFDVGDIDGDSALFFLRCIVDLIERLGLSQTFFGENLSDCGS